jgi:hypothetical protein
MDIPKKNKKKKLVLNKSSNAWLQAFFLSFISPVIPVNACIDGIRPFS